MNETTPTAPTGIGQFKDTDEFWKSVDEAGTDPVHKLAADTGGTSGEVAQHLAELGTRRANGLYKPWWRILAQHLPLLVFAAALAFAGLNRKSPSPPAPAVVTIRDVPAFKPLTLEDVEVSPQPKDVEKKQRLMADVLGHYSPDFLKRKTEVDPKKLSANLWTENVQDRYLLTLPVRAPHPQLVVLLPQKVKLVTSPKLPEVVALDPLSAVLLAVTTINTVPHATVALSSDCLSKLRPVLGMSDVTLVFDRP